MRGTQFLLALLLATEVLIALWFLWVYGPRCLAGTAIKVGSVLLADCPR
jgi:hypothetical protein